MLNFHTPTIEDRAWIEPVLSTAGGRGSEDAFGTLFIWSGADHTEVCRHGNLVFTRYGRAAHTYGFPAGAKSPQELKEALLLLQAHTQETGEALRLWGMDKGEREQIEAVLPGFFRYSSTLDDSDYLYAPEDLISLSGRKYHSKRNHIARFRRTYSYTYEPVSAENLEDCRQVARAWCLAHGCGGGLKDENCAIGKALDHFEALAFVGGLIRIDGKAVAFTAGEAINDQVFDVHFEKALDGYDGLYPAINQAFAEHALSGYRWINREEDMGLEGLRRAKASYYPAEVLEKFTAVRE